ncbi:hypothetical protein AWB77_00158 [Caballeronia fortuita]|uniref:Uncharacterized protein n=1 Tax=Caballeronia fortuita TaxID=1777138 RepID=A0A157Z363_9BURK|nr:hypothetical protein AWB77_00158 [Caballeronia fortuita]
MRLYRMRPVKLTKPVRKRALSRVFDESLTAANKVTRVLPTMTSRKVEDNARLLQNRLTASLRIAKRKLQCHLAFSLDYHC